MAEQNEQKKKTDGAAFDGQLVRRIGKYLVPYKGWVALAVVLTIAAAFMGPLRPKLIQVAIDTYIAEGGSGGEGIVVRVVEALRMGAGLSLSGFQVLVVLLVSALLFEGLLSFATTYLMQWIGQNAIYDLRTETFNYIQRQALKFFDRTPIGRLITRTTSDVGAISDALSSGLVTILGDIFRLVFITALMFSLNWVLALVTLAVMPLMVWATIWFRNNVRDQYRTIRKQVGRLNSFLQEHVTGMSVVQLFSREEEEMRRFEDINDAHRAAQIKTIFYYALFFPAVSLVANIGLGLVLWVGGLRALGGSLTLGVLIAFIMYVRLFFQPIRNLSDQYNTLQRAMAGAERIFDLLDEDHTLKETETPVEIDRLRGEIEFQNVWFTYDDVSAEEAQADGEAVNWILKDVSFRVDPGQTTALVGATGAGKTTVINLLLRFYEIQRGRILVDGIDLCGLRLKDLRRHIGLILQDVFLFSGSIEKNLTLDDDDITAGAVREAAATVQADRFIEQLPEKYQQDVKERGASLSHGQRQLLAFVRALLYDPDVLVLDEATSSVDTETEELIQQAHERLMEGRTTLAIAHRLSTIQDADQILVMHRGEIRERGTHRSLLAEDGLYRKLYELQYQDQEHGVRA